MALKQQTFNESKTLHHLRHYLPSQSPLKDFIHHNTLHAFQNTEFFDGINRASKIFGYKVSLSLAEYRLHYQQGRISDQAIALVLRNNQQSANIEDWHERLHKKSYDLSGQARVGLVRAGWEKYVHLDLDVLVHPVLFRIICSYLDQGISIWKFPILEKGLLNAIRELEKNSFNSFFVSPRAKQLLITPCKIAELLQIIVGDEELFEYYLFDQQFAHQGWSGMVTVIEQDPEILMDKKSISLEDIILLELLLEIDALDQKFGLNWMPLGHFFQTRPEPLFAPTPITEYDKVLQIWQEAYEWTYYDTVLTAIQEKKEVAEEQPAISFQAILCIDDREISFRDYLEKVEPNCQTFGTPGFFGVEFYFQPEHSRAYTKQCPAQISPKHLIKEHESSDTRKKDLYLTRNSHALLTGWVMAPTVGFWSAFRLFLSIFKPSVGPAVATSFSHMDGNSKLTIRHLAQYDSENGLQVGFTVDEMATRVKDQLTSIGLVKNFGKLVYVMGHGASSANNPHYAAYNCGACSGRPGSVNARVFASMANDPEVRAQLQEENFYIPKETWFVSALHDTTRDEMQYFDELIIPVDLQRLHTSYKTKIDAALDLNAKERARRFELIDQKGNAKKIHKKVVQRSVSLFEPRPELNHATNSLCIVGRRSLTHHIFLDRRAFANSYNYQLDLQGKTLANIMRPLGPVCGGINLEYYFSRVDHQKLGAGSKLPHNVMGLIGVANGFDGDLRPGLPNQMTEVHEPLRLLTIVEHDPDVILETIKSEPLMYEWYFNDWIHLVAIHPTTKRLWVFRKGKFFSYQTFGNPVAYTNDLNSILESSRDNLPVYDLSI